MVGYARVAAYSFLVNTLLMVAKYGLGIVSGSLALKADAIHSLADVVSALTIFLGIHISGRKTKTFPEGLYKVENLVALFSTFFIFGDIIYYMDEIFLLFLILPLILIIIGFSSVKQVVQFNSAGNFQISESRKKGIEHFLETVRREIYKDTEMWVDYTTSETEK